MKMAEQKDVDINEMKVFKDLFFSTDIKIY